MMSLFKKDSVSEKDHSSSGVNNDDDDNNSNDNRDSETDVTDKDVVT